MTAIAKLDLRSRYRELYLPSAREVVLVDVPELHFVMLDGNLEPGVRPGDSQPFRDAVAAMYGVAYGLKFMSKLTRDNPIDFTVMALEGLWSTGGGFDWGGEDPLPYTLLIMQPDHVSLAMFETAVAAARAKRPNDALDAMRLQIWREGLSVQTMHIGPYSSESATLERMAAFAAERGYRFRGLHHEIYIGDPTRSRPENLKTVLRHPVEL